MIRIALEHPSDLAGWRVHARAALAAELPPEAIEWSAGGDGLLDAQALPAPPMKTSVPRVSGRLLHVLTFLLAHSDPQRFALAYRLTWRQARGDRDLLGRITDTDVHRAMNMAKAVRRDLHKMKAFLRFRTVPLDPAAAGAMTAERRDEVAATERAGQPNEHYAAWFEPSHYIVDLAAPFFVRRYTSMRWSIFTPYRSASWDGRQLSFGSGATRAAVPADDAAESLWKTYYASIFNPARLNERMMRQEMPQKYWRNLPEARLIPRLVRDAGQRVRDMVERAPEPPRRPLPASALPAAPTITGSLADLRAAAADCRACPLWEPATQTVFGEGPADARIMIIGEQPGDEEDLSGRPFVGPAGRVFDRALGDVGIDRDALYVTNAVKHFKFEMRGRRRLHRNPERSEQLACRHWLQAELDRLQPSRIVCLGGTAAAAVFGREVKVTQARGRWHRLADGVEVMATVHPSYILRLPDAAAREQAYVQFRDDLALLNVVAA